MAHAFLLILFLVFPDISLAQASFNCSMARTIVEHAICSSKEISDLDRILGDIYSSKRGRLRDNDRRSFTESQRAWIVERDGRCVSGRRANLACLSEAYRARIAEISTAIPGSKSNGAASSEWDGRWRYAQAGFSGEMRIATLGRNARRVVILTAMQSGNFSTCDLTIDVTETEQGLIGRDEETGTAILIERSGRTLQVSQIDGSSSCGLNATFEGRYMSSR